MWLPYESTIEFFIYHYFWLFVHLILLVANIYTVRIECTWIYILRLEITKFFTSKYLKVSRYGTQAYW